MPDFLVMTYEECDFLWPKEEIVGSTMRNVAHGLVQFGDLALPELGLDPWLRTFFPRLSRQDTGLSIICRSEAFFPKGSSQTQDLIALTVGSESFVAEYKYSDFRLLPFLLRENLSNRGIVAVRFSGEKVQYLLDLASLLKGLALPERTAS